MKTFHCEYCGALIDIENDNVCPECGAAFDKNSELEKIRRLQEKKEQLENKRKKIELEEKEEALKRFKIENKRYEKNIENINKSKKISNIIIKIFLYSFIIFASFIAVIFITGVAIGLYGFNNLESENLETNEIVENVSGVIEPTFIETNAGFNEFANNGVLNVKVDEFEIFDSYPLKNDKGYVSVAIHFIIENTTNEIFDNEINVIVTTDDLLAEDIYFKYDEYKELKDMEIPANTKYDGYLLYTIPEDANKINIKYGEYITFTFDNPIKNEINY